MIRKLHYIMFLSLFLMGCKSKEKLIHRIEGYVYIDKTNPAIGLEIFYPYKIEPMLWSYQKLTITDEKGYFSIDSIYPRKNSFVKFNQKKDSIDINLYISKDENEFWKEENEFKPKYILKSKVDSIIKLDTIFLKKLKIKK